MKRALVALAVAGAAVSASPALAAPIYLDFTNASVYGAATGQTTFTVNDQGVAVNLQAASFPLGGRLHQTAEGFGVAGPTILDDDGEIGLLEVFVVNLSPSLELYEIYIQQLKKDCSFCSFEDGYYSINGGPPVNFIGNNASGFLTIPVNQYGVSSIAFAVGLGLGDLFDDFSVAGLSVGGVAIPEPALLLLMGCGLLALARRRRKQA